MTRHLRTSIALSVLGALVVSAECLAQGPAAPGVSPGFPSIGSIPGSAKARFQLFVEGEATARKDFSGGGTAGCVVAFNGSVNEATTYRRGKGVVMVFTRLGPGPRAPVIIQRAGRKGDSSFNLKVTTTRTATGSATRNDVVGAAVSACQPVQEDLAVAPACGRPMVDNQSAGLLYGARSGKLRLQLNFSGVEPLGCPDSQVATLDSLRFGWPAPPAAERLETFLPRRDVFDKRKRAIVLRINVSPPRRVGPTTFTLPGGVLRITETNFGTNRVTIRLVRIA